jgi:hypothetical protein
MYKRFVTVHFGPDSMVQITCLPLHAAEWPPESNEVQAERALASSYMPRLKALRIHQLYSPPTRARQKQGKPGALYI